MLWQDIILTGGSIVFIFALLPSVLSKDKPALATSLATGIVLIVFALVYFSLHLWMAGVTNSITSLLWFILALQKFLSNKKRN
jgi:uncharacterized membrane protein